MNPQKNEAPLYFSLSRLRSLTNYLLRSLLSPANEIEQEKLAAEEGTTVTTNGDQHAGTKKSTKLKTPCIAFPSLDKTLC